MIHYLVCLIHTLHKVLSGQSMKWAKNLWFVAQSVHCYFVQHMQSKSINMLIQIHQHVNFYALLYAKNTELTNYLHISRGSLITE